MRPIDPVRGPLRIPRTGKLPLELLPKPYEVVVLRSPSNRLVQLQRGCPPTFGQRMVGGFTEAYYVDAGRHTREFSVILPSADVGIDLLGQVDVELTVDDCCELVRERRGDLAEQLSNWCQERAARITSEFSAAGDEDSANLAVIGRKVADTLRSSNRPELFGLNIRELRVRLQFANQGIVAETGATTLSAMLRAKGMQRIKSLYEPVFGPAFAQVYTALVERHEDLIPEFVAKLQQEQQLTGSRKWELFSSMLRDSEIEPHFRERFAKELGKALLNSDPSNQDLALKLLSRTGEFELPASTPADGDESDQEMT
jgi:hypothetical protein